MPGLPGWFAAPRVAIRWRAADGSVQTVTVRSTRARMLHEIPAQTRRLAEELSQWHAETAPAGVRPLSSGEPPRDDAVTGTPYAELATARAFLPLIPILAGVGLLAALATGLPLLPSSGPGASDVIGAVLLALLAMRIPLWRASRPRGRAAKRSTERAA